MAIETSKLDDRVDAYAEGADARLAGTSETANPYPDGSAEQLSWNDGWASIDEEDDE